VISSSTLAKFVNHSSGTLAKQRVAKHENLWPGRKLRILFFPGNDVWTPAWVKSWTEVTVQVAGEISGGQVEWTLTVDFQVEDRVDIKNV
jgi:hypothetical protein